MNHYELMYIIVPTIDDHSIPQTVTKINGVMERFGAVLNTNITLGRKRLSYPIDHARSGVYQFVEFTAPGVALGLITRELELDKEILRAQTIKRSGPLTEVEKAKLAQLSAQQPIVAEDISPDRHTPAKRTTGKPTSGGARKYSSVPTTDITKKDKTEAAPEVVADAPATPVDEKKLDDTLNQILTETML